MTAAWEIVVVCEASGDRDVVALLSARVFSDFAQPPELSLKGLADHESFQSWAGIRKRGEKLPKRFGFGSGHTLDGVATWKALHLILELGSCDGVVLLRDSDGKVERLTAIRKAVDEFLQVHSDAFRVAVGVAHTKQECWLLCSLDEKADGVLELQRELGFNPVTMSHQLTSTKEGSKHDAKRVWRALELPPAQAIGGAPFERLMKNGSENGLADFLRELRCELGPVLVRELPPVSWCDCSETEGR